MLLSVFIMDKFEESNEEIWDQIAQSFDATRRKPWSQVIDFINNISPDAIVGDLGCGNGRHLIPCAERCHHVTGIDLSKNMLNTVQRKIVDKGLVNVDLIHGSLVNIPVKTCSFKTVLYIASLHNIQGKEYRIQSLREVKRILDDKGIALISVWSRWQDQYRNIFLSQQGTESNDRDLGDIEIPWRKDNLDVLRFYHLYEKNEFHEDIQTAGLFIKSIESVYLRSNEYPDNFFAVVRKK